MTSGSNRLRHERSPYLLQHANNPVDWNAWGDDAFERARSENKPVFLSIGYSACHWCHVMERESFEDPAAAAWLNEHFVSVKVDREERPDVDQIYQLAHQALRQRGGGWPLSMFLTADQRPFFGGTYFPNERRHGLPSFMDVLRGVTEAWRDRRAEVDEQASELTEALVEASSQMTSRGAIADDLVLTAVRRVLPRIDRAWGGFGGAPKFPNTMTLDLLSAAAAWGLEGVGDDARECLALTLDRMARGGIWDHLGEGFARYSTDARWHVPHFEKMLYDNALLARLYTDGASLVRDLDPITAARCEAVVRGVFAWSAREMTSPEGAFYSAQDADSEGEEGRFFAWTRDELAAVVGEDAAAVCAWYDVTAEGNWEHGNNVLWTPSPLDVVARRLSLSPEELTAALTRARPTLWAHRERRAHPMRDDKCLASWNALLISALAGAGAAFADASYVAAALRCLTLWRERAFVDGRLAHAIKDQIAYGVGFLDDHAGMACAALDVYEATFDPSALAFARALIDSVLRRFVDEATGEFYFTASDGEVVLHRGRDPFDHAAPGGAGLCLRALTRLAELTDSPIYRTAAERGVNAYAAAATEQPLGLATLTHACDRARRGPIEVVIMGERERDDTRALLAAARSVFVPHRLLVCVRDEAEARAHGLAAALTEGRSSPDGAPVAFVCRGRTCELPVSSASALRATLARALLAR